MSTEGFTTYPSFPGPDTPPLVIEWRYLHTPDPVNRSVITRTTANVFVAAVVAAAAAGYALRWWTEW